MPSSGVQTCARSEEHTSELQSHDNLVCRLLLEKKKLPDAVQGTLSSDALRLPAGTNVHNLPAFNQERVEVQDEGSQLFFLIYGAPPGSTLFPHRALSG